MPGRPAGTRKGRGEGANLNNCMSGRGYVSTEDIARYVFRGRHTSENQGGGRGPGRGGKTGWDAHHHRLAFPIVLVDNGGGVGKPDARPPSFPCRRKISIMSAAGTIRLDKDVFFERASQALGRCCGHPEAPKKPGPQFSGLHRRGGSPLQ